MLSEKGRCAVQAAADAASSVSFYTASLSASSAVRAAVDAIINAITAGGLLPVARAIEADARALQTGIPHEQVLGARLWNEIAWHQDPADDLWRSEKESLLRLGTHWCVWTDWYDHVLEGSHRSYAWERVFTDLEGPLPWHNGAEVVNGLIAKRLEAQHPPEPRPIQEIPSPIAIVVRADGRIGLDSNLLTTPAQQPSVTLEDYPSVVLTCRQNADSLRVMASAPSFQGRADYANALAEYLEWLPDAPRPGNVLLADTAARILNKLFTAEQDILPLGFAARLTTFLENHIALRAYYPELERHYQTVISGRLLTPLARDVVDGVQRAINDHTPAVFEDSVSAVINESAKPVPDATPPRPEDTPSRDPNRPRPPRDPIADVDPAKLRGYTFASVVNRIWTVLQKGKDLSSAIEGWRKAYDQMLPYMDTIIDWLQKLFSSD